MRDLSLGAILTSMKVWATGTSAWIGQEPRQRGWRSVKEPLKAKVHRSQGHWLQSLWILKDYSSLDHLYSYHGQFFSKVAWDTFLSLCCSSVTKICLVSHQHDWNTLMDCILPWKKGKKCAFIKYWTSYDDSSSHTTTSPHFPKAPCVALDT